MRKWLILLLVLLVLALLALAGSHLALRHEPDFYAKALAVEPKQEQQASDSLLAQATGLASQARKPGRWSLAVSTEEINGWLAVDLIENHAKLIPLGVSEPRVRIVPGEARLAFRYANAFGGPVVVSVIVDVHVAEPNVVSVRLRGLKSGAIPLPMAELTDEISHLAAAWQLPVRWTTKEGDPVALVDLRDLAEANESVYQLDSLEFRQGQVWLAGETVTKKKPVAEPTPPAVQSAQ